MFLRGEDLTPFRRAKARVLREKLESLEHEIKDRNVQESHRLGIAVTRALSRTCDAYRTKDNQRY